MPRPTILSRMSPVSRSRRGKKKQPKNRTHALSREEVPKTLSDWNLPPVRRQPNWFAPSTEAVLGRLDGVLAASGPRQLEQAVAELLGGQLHTIVLGHHVGLSFSWWFEELVESAADRVRVAGADPDGGWVAPWRLLHGLTSIGSPALASDAAAAMRKCRPGGKLLRTQPNWLRLMSKVSATGEVWQLRDTYGTRRALIAGYTYPGGLDRTVFLFDYDVSGAVDLVKPGVYDDVEEAAAAWRGAIGDTAYGVLPSAVESTDDLQALWHFAPDEELVKGTEDREVMDNWFRVQRRTSDLFDALRRRGLVVPEAEWLPDEADIDRMAEAFTAWHVGEHGGPPAADVVDALVEEWLEGALPDSWYLVSPARAEYQRALIGDWLSGDPVTEGAKALLPELVRWLGERAGLPRQLVDRAVHAAR